MNKRLVAYMQGAVLLIEAACMTPALVIALFQQDGDAWALGATMLILIAIGAPLRFLVRPGERNLRAREGFLTVALAWIALSCFGALPFVFSGRVRLHDNGCDRAGEFRQPAAGNHVLALLHALDWRHGRAGADAGARAAAQ